MFENEPWSHTILLAKILIILQIKEIFLMNCNQKGDYLIGIHREPKYN